MNYFAFLIFLISAQSIFAVDEINPQVDSVDPQNGDCPKPDRWFNRQIQTNKLSGAWYLVANNYEFEKRCAKCVIKALDDRSFLSTEAGFFPPGDPTTIDPEDDFPEYSLYLQFFTGNQTTSCEPGSYVIQDAVPNSMTDPELNLVRTDGASSWILALDYDRYMVTYTCLESQGQFTAQIHIYGRGPYLDDVDWQLVNQAIQQSMLANYVSISTLEIEFKACDFYMVEEAANTFTLV